MKYPLTAFALLISISTFAQDFFGDANLFFQKNVKKGLVNYTEIKQNPAELNKLLDMIATAPEFQGEQEKAFLINAYNLFIIKGIVDAYPTEGPMAISGFFDKKAFTLRGEKTSLNNVEKKTLAKQFPDNRLHFALVCAAIGCPKLPSFAFTPKELEQQLEDRTRFSVNDPSFVKVDGNKVQLSQIFEWYAADFGGRKELINYVQKYYLPKIKLSPKVAFYKYDWTLNELK
ncbi:MAG: DUF547 domain-containing protein [Flavobacteriales bacterium]|nr:DUF547 domain-containing protein [Flavobacteriales bacterium]